MMHIVFIFGLVNVAMTAAKTGLDRYAPTSKADTWLGIGLRGLSIALSFLTANTQSLPGKSSPVNGN